MCFDRYGKTVRLKGSEQPIPDGAKSFLSRAFGRLLATVPHCTNLEEAPGSDLVERLGEGGTAEKLVVAMVDVISSAKPSGVCRSEVPPGREDMLRSDIEFSDSLECTICGRFAFKRLPNRRPMDPRIVLRMLRNEVISVYKRTV